MKEGVKKWVIGHRTLLLVGGLLVFVLLLVFGAQIALYFNFILGNDIVIKLSADKESFVLQNDEQERVEFTASVTTNPFCSALCFSSFQDLGNNKTIGGDNFSLRPGLPFQKDYYLKPQRLGEGQELYRFNLDCHSVRSFLCHTDEKPTTRSIVVSVWHSLTKNEELVKGDASKRLAELSDTAAVLKGMHRVLLDLLERLDKIIITTPLKRSLSPAQNGIELVEGNIKNAQKLWNDRDYMSLPPLLTRIAADINTTEKLLWTSNVTLAAATDRFNLLLENTLRAQNQLHAFNGIFLTNKTIADLFAATLSEFSAFVDSFQAKGSIESKEKLAEPLFDKIGPLTSSYQNHLVRQTLVREIGVDQLYDVLCMIAGDCTPHPTLEQRANETGYDGQKSCDRIEELRLYAKTLKKTFAPRFVEQDYPSDKEFSGNITQKFLNLKKNVTLDYLARLPGEGTNTAFLRSILVPEVPVATANYSDYNLTPALIIEFAQHLPDSCKGINVSTDNMAKVTLVPIVPDGVIPFLLNISFSEPIPQCCVFGICRACCLGPECRLQQFPIVFLHGHAFNKDVSAEYSLDAFNKIQRKLESEGILSVGAISLYTKRNNPEGLWGMMGIPVAVKASYYYDIFKEPENYRVVQQKSEHIDTYAVRLKEVLDTIRYATGKDKVVIIAHSMGGLVARRYMQIFGSNRVDRLIMIGTPNKGIAGDAADYCSFKGEQRECDDLATDSVFMNKLNGEKVPPIPITNVVGVGCLMNGEKSDGVVLEKNAELEGADNLLVRGTCSGLDVLHTQLLDVDRYPKVYDIIVDTLTD